jgi:lysozyme family protein
MALFELFLPGLLRREGGYVNHPADPGAETYAGVARAYNPQWPGWPLVDAVKKKLNLGSFIPVAKYGLINKELAAEPRMKPLLSSFYKAAYWDALKLDYVTNQVLAEQMADHGTNAGPSRPAKMIQFAVNEAAGKALLVVDGQIGPKTLSAINAADQAKLLKAFVQLRRDHYEYRTAVRTPKPDVVALLKSLNVKPDPSQKIFLNSWLARLPKL